MPFYVYFLLIVAVGAQMLIDYDALADQIRGDREAVVDGSSGKRNAFFSVNHLMMVL
jgi:hypothetical protein